MTLCMRRDIAEMRMKTRFSPSKKKVFSSTPTIIQSLRNAFNSVEAKRVKNSFSCCVLRGALRIFFALFPSSDLAGYAVQHRHDCFTVRFCQTRREINVLCESLFRVRSLLFLLASRR
jgi:hypothetical protein